MCVQDVRSGSASMGCGVAVTVIALILAIINIHGAMVMRRGGSVKEGRRREGEGGGRRETNNHDLPIITNLKKKTKYLKLKT